MRLLNRYLLRQLAAPFIFALAAQTSLMLLSQVAKKFGALVGKGLPWTVIGEVFALSLPFIVAMTLPMAVLLAVLYTFSHLAADNEITAMRASGIGVWTFLRVISIFAVTAWVLAMFTVLYRVNNPRSQGAVGVGGFFLMRRTILERVGGYEALKDEVLEDVRLAEMEPAIRRLAAERPAEPGAEANGQIDRVVTMRVTDGAVADGRLVFCGR